MSVIFILKNEPPKKTQFSIFFLMGCYFVMVGFIDINIGVFLDTSAGFLKSVVSKI